MRFHSSYIIIPLLTIILALIGKLISSGCDARIWYQSLNLPALTPPAWIFPIVWNTIFALTAIAVIVVWNSFERTITFWTIISLFVTNAILNVLWTFLFFDQRQIGIALAAAIALAATTLALMVLIGQRSKLAALLLLPYVFWAIFAIYLNGMIWMIN